MWLILDHFWFKKMNFTIAKQSTEKMPQVSVPPGQTGGTISHVRFDSRGLLKKQQHPYIPAVWSQSLKGAPNPQTPQQYGTEGFKGAP